MQVEAFAPREGGWKEMREAAAQAEAAGFTHFAAPEITADPFVALAMAAHATERIGVRTAIAVAFPRSPMVVAGTAMDLHVNSGGRFTLGLGTQIKAHNERRFAVPWSKPRTRLKEYVEALRAIWRCWMLGERLSTDGEFYSLSLMTPEFSWPKNDLPPIPVYTAAVRPRMLQLAGEVADGVRLHGFCTRRYLEEVAMPEIEKGLEAGGRSRERFAVCGGGFVATGRDEAEVAKMVEFVRYRVAFYASTPAYKPVMDLHGWTDLHEELHRMTREGRWKEMAAKIPDDVVREFCAIGTYDELPAAVEARFGGISDSIEIALPDGTPPEAVRDCVDALKAIPTRFTGHAERWEQLAG